jgi:hypothetical protein
MANITEWVSGSIFQQYHGKNTLHFDEMNFYMLTHWNNNLMLYLSLNTDTFSWFWVSQSFLMLLYAACLELKQQIQVPIL